MAHIHEKIDFTATALIVHGNKVLLRIHDKYRVWLGVGGHIELDEDPVEALKREVKEECGLEFELVGKQPQKFDEDSFDLPVPAFLNRHHTDPNHEHIDLLYVARAKTLDIRPSLEEDQVEFRWFAADDLQEPGLKISQHIRYYAAEAIKIASV